MLQNALIEERKPLCTRDKRIIGLVPRTTVYNASRRLGPTKEVTLDNVFPLNSKSLLKHSQVEFIEDIIRKRDLSNTGMSRKECIQLMADLGGAKSLKQAENHFDYLIRMGCLSGLS